MKSEIYAYPSSGSWNNGSGEYLDNPSTVNGVGWEYRSNSGSNPWLTDNFEENTTGSFITASPGGGNCGVGLLWLLHSDIFWPALAAAGSKL